MKIRSTTRRRRAVLPPSRSRCRADGLCRLSAATDDTIVEAVEGSGLLNLAFLPVGRPGASGWPCSTHGAGAAAAPSGRCAGGHSKGGNLARSTARFSAPKPCRTSSCRFYNNDGPGFRITRSLLRRGALVLAWRGGSSAIIPESSVVGILPEHEERQ
ncbi:MAG: Mbeg1-like protein [Blautia wexlerae]